MSEAQRSPVEPLGYFVPKEIPRGRPAPVLVISILAILIGSYEAISMRSSIRMLMFVGIRFRSFDWPRAVFLLSGPIIFILGLILIIGGTLALLMKPMGRALLIFYAWASCALFVARAMSLYWIIKSWATMTPASNQTLNNGTVATTQITVSVSGVNFKRAMSAGWIAMLPSLVPILVWCIAILYFMNRRSVKSAFRRSKPVTGEG